MEPKSMAVLVALARRPGEVVSRQELLDAAWPQEAVTDDVLTRAVAELRKRFQDSAGEPRVIETIRGRGYRLIAPVVEAAGEASIDEAREDTAAIGAPTVPDRRTWSSRLGLIGLGLGVALIAGVLYWPKRAPSPIPAAEEIVRTLRVHPLTGSTAQDRDPDVSPDGTAVAYSQRDPETGTWHLFLKLIDSGQPMQLTSGQQNDRLPVFSPDGTRLSFVRLDRESCGVFQVAITGGPVRRLTECPPGRHLRMAWSPDGRTFARPQAVDERTVGLSLFDIETLESRLLTRPPLDFMDNEPTFSPDGRWLAFSRSDFGGVSDLYAVRLEDGEERRLTRDFRDISGQAWSNDPNRVVFSSDRAGIHSLWKVDLDGGEPQWLAGGGNKIKHPAHARQAEVIAYEEWQYEINLWRFDLRAGGAAEPEPLVQSTAWDVQPAFSPDGQHLAFTSNRSGSHELWLARADGAEPSRLTRLESGFVGQGVWSPDGASIVFVANQDGQTDLYRLDLGDVAPVKLTDDAHQELAPSWSRDGEAIYFSVDRGQGFQIRRLGGARNLDAPEPGEPVGELLTQGTAAVESPAGGGIYFSRLGDESLWWLSPTSDTEGGAEHLGGQALSTGIEVGFGRRHSWQSDASGIFFLERSARQSVLTHWPWPTSSDLGRVPPSPVPIGPVPRFGRSEFTVSPDGRFLVFARTDRAEVDILVARDLRLR